MFFTSEINLPAAKCKGVLFLPRRSLAFTLSGVVSSVLTNSMSPFLQASNKEGSPVIVPRDDKLGEEMGEETGDETDELLIPEASM